MKQRSGWFAVPYSTVFIDPRKLWTLYAVGPIAELPELDLVWDPESF